MRVNQVQNNINFKARAAVQIGEEFLLHTKNLEPDHSASILQGIIEAVGILKAVAKDIGADSDIIKLNSYKTRELDLSMNDHYAATVHVTDLPGDARNGMLYALIALSNKYRQPGKIADLIAPVINLPTFVFYPVKGEKKIAVKMLVESQKRTNQGIINIDDYANRVRALNTVV